MKDVLTLALILVACGMIPVVAISLVAYRKPKWSLYGISMGTIVAIAGIVYVFNLKLT